MFEMNTMRISAWAMSHIGGRIRCDDNALIDMRQRIFGVADGLGRYGDGYEASLLALCYFLDCFSVSDARETDSITRAVEYADFMLAHKNKVHNMHMRTTITVGRITKNGILELAHAGDCRAYLLSDGKLSLLTADHNMAGEMVKKGLLEIEAAKRSPYKSRLTSSIGRNQAKVDFIKKEIKMGDKIMFCSDGVYTRLTEKQIRDILASNKHPKVICQKLIEDSRKAGEQDNRAVVVAEVRSRILKKKWNQLTKLLGTIRSRMKRRRQDEQSVLTHQEMAS